MNAFVKTLAVLLPVAVLWGCSSTGDTETPPAEDSGTATQGPTTTDLSDVDTGKMEDVTPQYAQEHLDPNSDLAKERIIYFDFDESTIKPDARAILEKHARYLAKNPNIHITIEGHGDERGTREYNLGLGERRSKAVAKLMELMGVSADQLDLVSYGEERPAAMGHDESSWSQNRRAELDYQR